MFFLTNSWTEMKPESLEKESDGRRQVIDTPNLCVPGQKNPKKEGDPGILLEKRRGAP